MPVKKIRTEYMKRFREPQWAQFGQCYQELLRYRLSRRLLEQAHNPWLWPDEGASSDGSSDPCSPGQQEPPEPGHGDLPAAQDTPEPQTTSPPEKQTEVECGQRNDKRTEVKEKEKSTSRSRDPRSLRAVSHKAGPKLARSPERIVSLREMRHPFALYASGEKRKDTGSQKTHNVCAPAPENEIHDSALRAKKQKTEGKKETTFAEATCTHCRHRKKPAEQVFPDRKSLVDGIHEMLLCQSPLR